MLFRGATPKIGVSFVIATKLRAKLCRRTMREMRDLIVIHPHVHDLPQRALLT